MSVAKLFKLFFASHEFGGTKTTKTEKIVKKISVAVTSRCWWWAKLNEIQDD